MGYIKLSRKIFEHRFFEQDRKFSKWEALVDLIHLARYSENKRVLIIKDREIPIERGEIAASIRFLAKRWKWSNDKVFRYLNGLEMEGTLKVKQVQQQNVITLCHYDLYQDTPNENRTATEQQPNSNRTATERNSNKGEIKGVIKESLYREENLLNSQSEIEDAILNYYREEMTRLDLDKERAKFYRDNDTVKTILNNYSHWAAENYKGDFDKHLKRWRRWLAENRAK